MPTYRANGSINHGYPVTSGVGKNAVTENMYRVYKHGEEIDPENEPGWNEEQVKALRASKILMTPEEFVQMEANDGNLKPAAELAAQKLALQDELAQARAEIERLRAAVTITQDPTAE
jgi:hypothetical protein